LILLGIKIYVGSTDINLENELKYRQQKWRIEMITFGETSKHTAPSEVSCSI